MAGRATRRLRRLALLAAGLVAGLAGLELACRARWDALPSVAALLEASPREVRYFQEGPGNEPPRCHDPPGFATRPVAWDLTLPGAEPPLEFWAAGDSVVLGWGVAREDAFAWRLARRVAEATGRAVHLVNMGLNGMGYCASLRELHGHLDRRAPDIVLFELFADDLASRAMVLVKGQVVRFPAQEPNPALRWLVSRSYLANWVWVTVRARRADGPTRFVDGEGQRHFVEAIRELADRLEATGSRLVLALVPPAGLPWCDPEHPRHGELPERALGECAWLRSDMDLMAALLQDAGIPFVDLRDLWRREPSGTLPEEVEELRLRARLPIHPDARGHASLAEALWPAVARAFEVPLAEPGP